MKNPKLKTTFLLVSISLFLLSLSQNAYCTNECTSSILALAAGWLGLLVETGDIVTGILEQSASLNRPIGSCLTWLANPLYMVSVFFFAISPRSSLIFSIPTIAIMGSFSLFSQVLRDEAGHYATITSLESGYYLWIGSALVIIIGSLIMMFRKEK